MKFAYLKPPENPKPMARSLLLIVVVVHVSICSGQTTASVDSLLQVVRRHTARDTTRVTTLLRLADAMVYTDPTAAMRYTEEALDIAEKANWAKDIALSLRQKGNVYYVLSDNPAAMDCYVKALRVAGPLHIRQLDATLFNNLANIYSDLKQYDKALDYYRQLQEASRSLGSKKDETIALVNMGTVYTEMNDPKKALECGQQALAICRKEGITYFIPIILNNLGITYNKKGETDSALAYFSESIRLADRYQNFDAKAASLDEIGKIYLTRGDYTHAEKYAFQSLRIARQLQSVEWQSNAWQSLYGAYEKQHRYDKALDAYRQFIVYRDSVSNTEKQSLLTRKGMQFDFERKEAATKAENDKKAALAQAEINRQSLIRRSVLAGSVILLIAALTSFLFYKRRRDADERRKEADLKAKVSDTEMKALRLQMNPHFIFNSLNSVSDYISKHDTKTANYFLSKFAKMMRQVLENSEKSGITLAEDLQMVETYIQLESLRLKNDLRYEIRIDPDIDPEATLVPPLIIQPFVENSIWHGLSTKAESGKISICITRQGEMIHYIVEDNGIGRKEAGKHSTVLKRSMGMRITRDRIDIINQTKKTNAGVEIVDLSEGTRVELKLPLELNY